jgi:hypothetical protein
VPRQAQGKVGGGEWRLQDGRPEGQIGHHPADRRQALAGADPGVPKRRIGACVAGTPLHFEKNKDRQIEDLPVQVFNRVISNCRFSDRTSVRSRPICLLPPQAAQCYAAVLLLAVVEQ